MEFIQYIPQAMLQSIGFMALLFLLFEGIQFWKKTTPNQKYWLAVIFYMLALIHFIVNLFFATNTGSPQRIIPISGNHPVQWLTYIGLFYLIVVAVYVMYFIVQWTKLIQVKSTANFDTNHALAEWMETELQTIGTSRKVHLGFSKQIETPVTFGWMEPIILMPFAMLNQLSTEEIKFILLHEVAHIIRHDFIILILVEMAQMFLCFNPFSYYFSKKIQLEREKACDDWVVANTKSPLPYTKALFQLAKFNYKHHNKLSLAAGEKGSALLARIQHINGLTSSFKSSKLLLIKGLAGVAFASLLLFNMDQSVLVDTASNPMKQSNIKHFTKMSSNAVLDSKPYTITKIKTNTNTDLSIPMDKSNAADSMVYHELIQSTIAWIKAREGNQNEEAVFANFSDKADPYEYTVAEQLMLRAVLHNYALKRTILANKILKSDSQEAALTLMRESKEWKAIQQYEKWASRFLQQHPNLEDTTSKANDF